MIIYLVQGQAKNIRKYLHLRDRPNCMAYFLTYDEPLSGAEYFPNSTWAEGRNYLLSHALSRHADFEYIVFSDDDVKFYLGGWDEWEAGLARYKPKVAVPVVDRTANFVLPYPLFQVQRFTANDEQLMAISKSALREKTLVPYKVEFDALNWYATCRLQEIEIQSFYSATSLQFNFVRVANEERCRYAPGAVRDHIYVPKVLAWCATHYQGQIKDIIKQPTRRVLWRKSAGVLLHSAISKFGETLRNTITTIKGLMASPRKFTNADFLDRVKRGEQWAIYGFGSIGQDLYRTLEQQDMTSCVKYVVDSGAPENGKIVDGLHISNPTVLARHHDLNVLVSSKAFASQIVLILQNTYQIPAKRIFLVS